jgi:hypothetical protein
MAPSPKKHTVMASSTAWLLARACLLQLLRVGGAHRNRQPGRHHAVGAQHAHGKIGDVHRTTLAAVEAGGLAEQLGHHAAQVRALGQRVAVPSVGGGEVVGGMQVRADAGGHRLLPGGQVQGPAHPGRAGGALAVGADAALAGDFGGILECPDAYHGAVKARQNGGGFW